MLLLLFQLLEGGFDVATKHFIICEVKSINNEVANVLKKLIV